MFFASLREVATFCQDLYWSLKRDGLIPLDTHPLMFLFNSVATYYQIFVPLTSTKVWPLTVVGTEFGPWRTTWGKNYEAKQRATDTHTVNKGTWSSTKGTTNGTFSKEMYVWDSLFCKEEIHSCFSSMGEKKTTSSSTNQLLPVILRATSKVTHFVFNCVSHPLKSSWATDLYPRAEYE